MQKDNPSSHRSCDETLKALIAIARYLGRCAAEQDLKQLTLTTQGKEDTHG